MSYHIGTHVFTRAVAFLMMFVCLCTTPVVAQTESFPYHKVSQSNILLLYSYGHGGKGISVFDESLINTFSAGGIDTNSLFFEFLDLERNKADPQYRNRIHDLLRQKYAERRIDVVVTVQQPALNWLLNEGKEIASDAPIISLQAPTPTPAEVKSRRILSMLTNFDMKGTLERALELFPDTKRVLFVSGNSDADKKMATQAARIAEPLKGTLEFEYSGDLSLNAMLKRAVTLPPHSIIIFTQYNRDSSGLVTVAYEVEGMIVKAANAPVFGLYDFNLINGGIGGSVIGVKELGEKTASTAMDLLNGRLQMTQPVSSATLNPVPMFNWEQIKHWGGNVSGLPSNTVFVNRVPTFWEQYRLYLIGVVIFVVAQSFLIATLLISRRNRKRAERSLQKSEENLAITLHSIGDAVIATDPEGLITRMNETAQRLSGWSLADALGRPLAEVFHIVNADTRETVLDPVQLVLAQGQVVGLANHTVLLAKDGQEYQIADSAAPIRDAANEIVGVVLVFSDVTEKYQAEAALRESERRFRGLYEQAPLPYQSLDIEANILEVNEAWLSMLGYTRDEVIGHFIGDFLTEISIETLSGEFPRFKTRGRVDGPEFELTCKNGTLKRAVVNGRIARDSKGNFQRTHCILTDITERKQAEAALRESEERWKFAIEGAGDGIWDWNVTQSTVFFSKRWKEMLGFTPDEIGTGLDEWSKRVHPDDMARVMADIQAHLDGKTATYVNEHRVSCKDGSYKWILDRGLVVSRDAEGKPLRMIGTHADINNHKKAEEEIHSLAFSDFLTSLPNRRLLMDRLEQAMVGAVRHGQQGALLFVDMDDFKTLNDSLGHDKGDQLLQQIAGRVLTCVREGDTVARLGGDEFVVLLEDLDRSPQEATKQAEVVASKIHNALRQPYQLDSHGYHNTASIGITLFGGAQRESIEEPLKRAELAMYKAKAVGRDNLRFFEPEMRNVINARASLEADLHEALAKGQFIVYYQAQGGDENRISGVEALVRWQHPERGLISPTEFIPVAEANGLILPLGHWVLETACKQLAAWALRPEMAHLTIAVNVSARQFRLPNFVEEVLTILEATGANPKRLKLELTESLLLDNMKDIIAKMTALKASGVGFSLDDFGTGYSSLSYLKRLPLDQLKIDQSFVRDILTDPNDAAIAKMVVALADSMGLAVIAEGVETEAQRAVLAGLGCHAYQGYLFSKPLPLEEFEAFAR